jgi:hypothetical protein
VQKWDLSCREWCGLWCYVVDLVDTGCSSPLGFVVLNIWVWEQNCAWVVTVTDYSSQTPCSAKVLFYCVVPSVTLMVKWPISGLRISEFKKLLNRMCLYIGVIIEGLLERKLYPSNSSSYQMVQFLLISLIILVLYILDTNTCIITHIWFDVLSCACVDQEECV